MALQYNVTTERTQELIAIGDNVSTKSIHITNRHASLDVLVDLYLLSSCGANRYYLLYQHKIEKGQYVVLNHQNVSFNNRTTGFGLYIKLNNSHSTVDVLIS
tara:strand:- start:48 stop:353 length:306 start_codon:yes stop_codon:yes gene_type:complete